MAELGERMSNSEFVQWAMWHARKAQRRELAEKVAKHKGR